MLKRVNAVALLSFIWLAAGLVRGAEPPPDKPEVEFHLNINGVITQWLAAPQLSVPFKDIEKAPALGAPGEKGPGDGAWRNFIFDQEFCDFKSAAKSAKEGVIWATCKLRSPGGKRTLMIFSAQSVKVFLNGQLVGNKPQQQGQDQNNKIAIAVDLPKGDSQLVLASEVSWGSAWFAAALHDEKNAKPATDETTVLPRSELGPANSGEALAQAVCFVPSVYFVDAGSKIDIAVGLRAGYPTGIAKYKPRFIGADGKALEGTFPARTPDEAFKAAWQTKVTLPKDAGPTIELKCELLDEAGTQVLGTRSLRIFVPGRIAERVEALQKQCDEVRAAKKFALPVTRVALEKIPLWFERFSADTTQLTPQNGQLVADLLASAEKFFAIEKEGGDPYALQTGYFERAHESAIDSSAQPYYVNVPEAAKAELAEPHKEGAKKYPLVIYLHGYIQAMNKHTTNLWTPLQEFVQQLDKRGAFVAVPFARSNSDFLGAGEVDVLDVLAEMKRLYPIDEDRVYLYGYSMGGMGVYSVAGHNPGPWAAAVVHAGRADSPLLRATQGINALAEYKQFLIRTDQPIDLVENFINIPLRIYHGKDDSIVNYTEAERMVKSLKAIGCDAELTLLEGTHWAGLETMAAGAEQDWLLKQVRKTASEKYRFKTFTPRGVGALGFHVNHLSGALEPCEFEWKIDDKIARFGRVMGSAEEFSFTHPTGKEVVLPTELKDWTADAMLAKEPAANTPIVCHAKDWEGESKTQPWNPAWKNPARCGPVKEATYSPFIVVYGTQGGEKVVERLKKQAQQFQQEWYDFAKGVVALKSDKDVTPDDLKTKNLILVGEEQENSVHAAAAATGKLPVSVKDGQVTIGAKKVALEGNGILYLYPNPLPEAGADRTLVILAGLSYGQFLPENHKLDLVPDLLFFNGEKDTDGTDMNKALCAAFFDGKWKLDPKLTWWFENKK